MGRRRESTLMSGMGRKQTLVVSPDSPFISDRSFEPVPYGLKLRRNAAFRA